MNLHVKTWTIKKRIITGFAGVIGITLALGGFAWARLATVQNHSNQITQLSLPAIEVVYHLQNIAKENVLVVYKYIGSDDPADKARLAATLADGAAENTRLYDQMDRFVPGGRGRALLDQVKAARGENTRLRARVLEAGRSGTNILAVYTLARSQLDPATARYLTALEGLVDDLRINADDAGKAI